MPRPVTSVVAIASMVALAIVGGAFFSLTRGRRAPPASDDSATAAATAPLPALPVAVAPPAAAAVPAAQPPTNVPKRLPPTTARDLGTGPVDEPALMSKLRALEATNPPLTLQLARDGNRRFPDTPDAPERAWMAVKALANMEKFKEARDEAQVMVKRYPGTSWSLDVQRHLLSNPLE